MIRYFKILLLLLMLLPVSLSAYAQSGPVGEYDVKAAFLYNFGRYTEWPSSAFANPSSTFQLCVLGSSPFGNHLNSILSGKRINGHPIHILYGNDPSEMTACHLAFISASLKGQHDEILGTFRGLPMLTVSETWGFTQKGGIINFLVVEGKVRFVINVTAARKADLKISSQLLKLAVIANN
jgi:hypothetical protein